MKRWTVMVYMAGDNGKIFDDGGRLMFDLQAFGWRNLADMAAVGSTGEVAIVSQYDTLDNRQFTPRFFMDGSTPSGRLVEKLPPVNTGDPKNLTDFIVWGETSYPAQRYALVLWNHGSGWKEDDIYARYREQVEKAIHQGETRAGSQGERLMRNSLFLATAGDIMSIEDDDARGICYDDSSLDFLDNQKMMLALQAAEAITGRRISLLGMDACLMSMVEVAHQLRKSAEVMVGSQELEPGEGWPYGAILRRLAAGPEMSPRELGAAIVQEYHNFYLGPAPDQEPTGLSGSDRRLGARQDPGYSQSTAGSTRGGGSLITQSAIDLEAVGKLGEGLGGLAQELAARYDDDFQLKLAIDRALDWVQRFRGDRDYIDLYDFLHHLGLEYADDGELAGRIQALQAAMEPSAPGAPVLANITSEQLPNAHGLSIYFPTHGCSQYYDRNEIAKMGWLDLIRKRNGMSS